MVGLDDGVESFSVISGGAHDRWAFKGWFVETSPFKDF
jgi:hypothetical protein